MNGEQWTKQYDTSDSRGKRRLESIAKKNNLLNDIVGYMAFELETSFGYPHEMFFEDLKRRGLERINESGGGNKRIALKRE
jgi:alanyl-tRNA synthetase